MLGVKEMENENTYCPIIHLDCKQEDCVFWTSKFCSIFGFFMLANRFLVTLTGKPDSESYESDDDGETEQIQETQKDAQAEHLEENNLEVLFSQTPGEIAEEMIRLADEDRLLEDINEYLPYDFEKTFWLTKGLTIPDKELPLEYLTLKKRAWMIAQTKIRARNAINKSLAMESEESLDNVDDETTLGSSVERIEDSLPSEVIQMSNEDLGLELLKFAKKMETSGKHDDILNFVVVDLFWKTKGIINTYAADANTQVKIKQVENSARTQLANEVFSSGNEQLSQELVNFIKSQSTPESLERISVPQHSYSFWTMKGIGRITDLIDVNFKKQEIERLAQQCIEIENDENEKQILEKEKTELPDLQNGCVEWARKMDKKSVTLLDIEYFLLQKNKKLHNKTARELYLGTNIELKNKRPAASAQDNLFDNN